MPYVFPGLNPFVDSACEGFGTADADDSRRAEQRHHAYPGGRSWHAKAINDALGQLPSIVAEAKIRADGEKQVADALDRIAWLRTGLACQLRACDDAIQHVKEQCGLIKPEPEPEPDARQTKRSRG